MPADSSRQKPYNRPPPKDTPRHLADNIDNALESSTPLCSQEFMSLEEYENVEFAFLNKIPQPRRTKTLLTAETYNRIMEILLRQNEAIDDAKFRYWARALFDLQEAPSDDEDLLVPDHPSGMVLVQKGLYVVTKDRAYEIICNAHTLADHGGRDLTQAIVRQTYACIPKELVAEFVKRCPTCALRKQEIVDKKKVLSSTRKKRGRPRKETYSPDTLTAVFPFSSSLWDSPDTDDTRSPGTDTSNDSFTIPPLPALHFEFLDSSGPADLPPPLPAFFQGEFYSAPVSRSSSMPLSHSSGLNSHPMSREVSLFHGLPNGWQFHTDFDTALSTFVDSKDDLLSESNHPFTRKTRSRIPSVAPLRTSTFNNVDPSLSHLGTAYENHHLSASFEGSSEFGPMLYSPSISEPPSSSAPSPSTSFASLSSSSSSYEQLLSPEASHSFALHDEANHIHQAVFASVSDSHRLSEV